MAQTIFQALKGIPPLALLRISLNEYLTLGVVLGIGVGLLLDSVLVVLGGIGTVWLTLLTFGLLMIGPIVLGGHLGSVLEKRGLLRHVRSWVIVLVAFVIWPVCVYAPVGLRTFQLRSLLLEIPVYPNFSRLEKTVSLFGTDGGPPYAMVSLRTRDDETKILQFYRTELTRRGWKELQGIEGSLSWFEQLGRMTSISIQVSPDQGGSYRWVEVIAKRSAELDLSSIERLMWSAF